MAWACPGNTLRSGTCTFPGGPPHLLSGIANIYRRVYCPFQSGPASLPYLSLFSAPHVEAFLGNTNQIMSLPCSKLLRDFLLESRAHPFPVVCRIRPLNHVLPSMAPQSPGAALTSSSGQAQPLLWASALLLPLPRARPPPGLLWAALIFQQVTHFSITYFISIFLDLKFYIYT